MKEYKRCKWLYADWCHNPNRCINGQELCMCYFNNEKCPDYEPSKKLKDTQKQ